LIGEGCRIELAYRIGVRFEQLNRLNGQEPAYKNFVGAIAKRRVVLINDVRAADWGARLFFHHRPPGILGVGTLVGGVLPSVGWYCDKEDTAGYRLKWNCPRFLSARRRRQPLRKAAELKHQP
jgi:hypothetical protein